MRSSQPMARHFLIILGLAMAVQSCRQESGPSQPDEANLTQEVIAPTALVIGHSIKHRPIVAYRFGTGSGGILFMASIHGSEGAGTPLLHEFRFHLEEHPELWHDVPIILIPVSNPDGLESKRRHNFLGVDLNRNFPADNRRDSRLFGESALSEPESRALYDFIRQIDPAIILSFHEPLNCLDYDGPGAELAEVLAARCDLPVKKLGSRPGSLGAWFGETLGKPIITVEFSREVSYDGEVLWSQYREMLLAAIRFHATNKE